MRIISRAEAKEQGLTQYFTGKPCVRGHIAPRTTVNGSCYKCSLYAQFERSRIDQRIMMARCAKYRARARQVPYAITFEDIIIPSHCPCCGIRLVPKSERLLRMKTGAHDTPSLDRKVPDLGYVPGNIAVLCMACNAKKAGIDEQMLKFLQDYLS